MGGPPPARQVCSVPVSGVLVLLPFYDFYFTSVDVLAPLQSQGTTSHKLAVVGQGEVARVQASPAPLHHSRARAFQNFRQFNYEFHKP